MPFAYGLPAAFGPTVLPSYLLQADCSNQADLQAERLKWGGHVSVSSSRVVGRGWSEDLMVLIKEGLD